VVRIAYLADQPERRLLVTDAVELGANQSRLALDWGGEPERSAPTPVAAEEQPFAEHHEWEAGRYAGVFVYWPVLIGVRGWLERVMGNCGGGWRIFATFVLMSARDIPSIEQLKHVRRTEAGRVLDLGQLPSLPGV
jgi:hypothetical protein